MQFFGGRPKGDRPVYGFPKLAHEMEAKQAKFALREFWDCIEDLATLGLGLRSAQAIKEAEQIKTIQFTSFG